MLARLGQLINEAPRRKRMGEAAAEYAKTFHWDRVVKQWEEMFENVRSRNQESGIALN
jgi:glycosyltransferase involved in cell wall biosynthesis